MTWWGRLLTTLRSYGGWFGPYGLQDPALQKLFGGTPVSSGVTVTEQKALTTSAVWACVQLIAGTVGSLPLIHYRRLATGGKERFTESRLYRLLHDAPNDEMAASAYLETSMQYVLLYGNSFSEIRRDNRGQVAALYLIEPWRVTAERNAAGQLRYIVDGKTKLQPEEVVHVPGLTPDGIWGYSVIQKARETVGLSLAGERFGGSFFANGTQIGGLLTHPGRLSEQAETRLRDSLEKRAQGVERAHNFVILQEGMTYEKLNIPPNDAQWLESRKFQTEEICRWFGVPPHMIGDVDRSTSWGTGIEQQTIGFVTFTLRRWLVRFEKEMTRKLISPLEYNYQSVEFLLDGLQRGDSAARAAFYASGIASTWLKPNEARRLENLDPLGPEGDVLFVPKNMTKLDRLDEIIDAEIAPTPAPAPPPAAPAPSENGPSARRLDELCADLEALMALGRESLARVPERPPIPLDPTVIVARTVEEIKALPPPPLPPPVDLTPVLARLDAAEVERKAQAERLEGVLPSVHLVIEEVARDFVRREGDRALRAAGTPEKLAAWLDEFYPRQVDYAVKKFLGPVQIYARLIGRAEPEREIREIVNHYLVESRRALAGLLGLPGEDVKDAVQGLVARWEAERPAELARALVAGADAPRQARTWALPPRPAPRPEPEPVIVEKEVTERDGAGRAQKVRETQIEAGEVLVVDKEVVERDSLGRAQKIREIHRRRKGD